MNTALHVFYNVTRKSSTVPALVLITSLGKEVKSCFKGRIKAGTGKRSPSSHSGNGLTGMVKLKLQRFWGLAKVRQRPGLSLPGFEQARTHGRQDDGGIKHTHHLDTGKI